MPTKTQHLLALKAGTREWGVAVFANEWLQHFMIKSLPHHLPLADRLAYIPALLRELREEFQPDILILFQEDRAAPTLRALVQQVKTMAANQSLPVRLYPLIDVRRAICAAPTATKRQISERLIERFPTLQFCWNTQTRRLPPYYQRMFDAIAVGYTHARKKR